MDNYSQLINILINNEKHNYFTDHAIIQRYWICTGKQQRQTVVGKIFSERKGTVFIEMTQEEMDALAKNDLPYLEIDWPYSAKKTQEEMEDWAIKVKNRADKAGIVIWSVHLPFGGPYDISQTNDTLRQRAVELI